MIAIMTKYHSPTNTRGSRISASTCNGHRVSIPYAHDLSTDGAHRLAAQALCDKMGWDHVDLIEGGIKNGSVFVMVPKATS